MTDAQGSVGSLFVHLLSSQPYTEQLKVFLEVAELLKQQTKDDNVIIHYAQVPLINWTMENRYARTPISENIGNELTLVNCAMNLMQKYPDKKITVDLVKRYYNIVFLLANKASTLELYDEKTTTVYSDPACEPGALLTPRVEFITQLFRYPKCSVACFSLGLDVENPDNLPTPEFDISELLESDESYQVFKNYWETL